MALSMIETPPVTATEAKISARSVDFFYGSFQALKGITLDIPPNQVITSRKSRHDKFPPLDFNNTRNFLDQKVSPTDSRRHLQFVIAFLIVSVDIILVFLVTSCFL